MGWENYGSTPVDRQTGKALNTSSKRGVTGLVGLSEPAGHARYGSQRNPIWSPGDGTVRSGTTVQGASGNWITGGTPGGGIDDFLKPRTDPTNPTNPGGGGGGGGGGALPPDWGTLTQLFNRLPQGFKYQNLKLPEYKGTGFYKFNPAQYDMMRTGIQEGLAADRATGSQAYGEARGELERYQNPFAGRAYTQNPEMSAAMQRMMQANGVQPDSTEIGRGVQADQAFGNVLALLGGNAEQRQAAELRALGGDERRFGESLDSQGRTMTLSVDMALAKARDQYEKDKWAYGEDIARQNYQTRVAQATANNQGQNQTNMANTQAFNDYVGGNADLIAQLAASGQKVPASVTNAVTNLGPALEAAMKAAAAGGGA